MVQSGLFKIGRFGYISCSVLILALLFSALPSQVKSANLVDIGMTSDGSHDTIKVLMTDSMKAASFDIYLENDIPIYGLSLGFQLWGSDGITWTYPSLPESYGPVPGEGWLTITPGSRLDPPNEAFDMTGLLITERDVDGQLRDSILLGGVSLFQSLAPGPLEQMISINVDVRRDGSYFLSQICFDTAFIPPVGELFFVDAGGQTFHPGIAWAYGERCWPVLWQEPDFIFADAVLETDPLDRCIGDDSGDETLVIHVGNFDAYGASGVQPSTVKINNYLTPATVSVIPSWPGFSGSVLELTIAKRDFVLYFPALWTSHMRYVGVGGILYNGDYFSATGQFELLANTSGDANADCTVDIGDVVRLIDYLYRTGSEPEPWEPADPDGNGSVDIADPAYLLNYIFFEGPPPTHVPY